MADNKGNNFEPPVTRSRTMSQSSNASSKRDLIMDSDEELNDIQQKKTRADISYIDQAIESRMNVMLQKFLDENARKMNELLNEKFAQQHKANTALIQSFNQKVEAIKTDVDALKQENEILRRDLTNANQKLVKIEMSNKTSTEQIDRLNQEALKRDIFIEGLPKMTNDDIDNTLRALSNFIKSDVTKIDFEHAYVSKSKDKNLSAINIRFKSMEKKVDFLKKFKAAQKQPNGSYSPIVGADIINLPNDNIAKASIINVNVCTTKMTRELFNAGRKLKKVIFTNVWLDHSGIVKASLLNSGKIIQLKSMANLKDLHDKSKVNLPLPSASDCEPSPNQSQ
jgi:regulator of PEP synthase PpsR (kinase-PPPase family)